MDKKKKSNGKWLDTRRMTVIGILGAICIVLGTTPLGFIPIGPTKATIMHIPVLIGAILEGPIVGMAIGLIFGLFSMFNALTNPTPVSFIFLNPVVAILPRILMGVVAYYVYDFFESKGSKNTKIIINIGLLGILLYLGNSIRTSNLGIGSLVFNIIFILIVILLGYYINKQDKEILGIVLSASIGTLTNTLGVLSAIYFIYAEKYMVAIGEKADLARNVIFGIGITNGIPELILAIVITVSVVGALKKIR